MVRTEAARQQKVTFALLCSRLALWLQEARKVGTLEGPVPTVLGHVQSMGSWVHGQSVGSGVHGRADPGKPAFVLRCGHMVW